MKVRLESENLTVESLRYNGTDIAGSEIEVQPGADGKLEVMAVCDLGRLDGVVETADGRVVSGATIWLFRESQLNEPIRRVASDQVGHFEIRNISAGEYRIIAVDDTSDRSALVQNVQKFAPKYQQLRFRRMVVPW